MHFLKTSIYFFVHVSNLGKLYCRVLMRLLFAKIFLQVY